MISFSDSEIDPVGTLTDLKREYRRDDHRTQDEVPHESLVSAAIIATAEYVARVANFAELTTDNVSDHKLSIPRRAAWSTIASHEEIKKHELAEAIRHVLGETALKSLSVRVPRDEEEPLYRVTYGFPSNRAPEIKMQRIEALPHDEQERLEAIEALAHLQSELQIGKFSHEKATHVIWNPVLPSPRQAELYFLDARREKRPLHALRIPEISRGDRPLSAIINRIRRLGGF